MILNYTCRKIGDSNFLVNWLVSKGIWAALNPPIFIFTSTSILGAANYCRAEVWSLHFLTCPYLSLNEKKHEAVDICVRFAKFLFRELCGTKKFMHSTYDVSRQFFSVGKRWFARAVSRWRDIPGLVGIPDAFTTQLSGKWLIHCVCSIFRIHEFPCQMPILE